MKDRFGHDRGACKSCENCEEFLAQEKDVKCAGCGCKPVSHELVTCIVWEDEEICNSVIPDEISDCSLVKVQDHSLQGSLQGEYGDQVQVIDISMGSRCGFNGCYNQVEFDVNTGYEYLYCSSHNGGNNHEEDIIIEDVEDPQYGTSSSYSVSVPLTKCAIPECSKPCYVDDNGHTYECCGFTHAMEYQRRLAIEKSANIIKGVTHCLLPECNKLTWPFKNYCTRTHAELGKHRGLTAPSTLTKPAVTKDDICIIPDCTAPKFKEKDGSIVHPYCSKSHAEMAKELGIFPSAKTSEEQCELEGCTRPKYVEDDKTHDYCCLDHAKKDAPNRNAKILTSVAKVNEWLSQFKGLKVVSLEENDHAKPGGSLFNKFRDKMMSLPKDQRQTCLAFHGTSPSSIPSIFRNGYDSSKRCGQSYGEGEYFATTPEVSMGYCRGGNKMIVNELLLGQSGTHHTQHGNIIVMKDPIHDLPRFTLTFQ